MARQTGSARSAKSERRKEDILRGAERVFAEKGFLEATISEVARRSGVSEATIYDYFGSKEEILFTIPLETTRRGKEKLEEYLTYIRSASDRLRAIIHNYLDFYEKHPDYAAVALLILKQNPRFLETEAYRIIREWSRTILRVVEEGKASGEFRSQADAYVTRTMVLGAVEHAVIGWLLLGRPSSPSALAETLSAQIIQGLDNPDRQGWRMEISLTADGRTKNYRLTPEEEGEPSDS
ncbi:MAG: TetR/AcrR family transcriptional regulator [Desulfohalobiaceae bacterium]|nr:TetR/AcrR family transcriptional regulator [Desulfohalobiaceae bacterium]MCF8086122.1 TetR/AcrR family transcriptional regulator [Desulfohalobiaceae bacterium]